VEAWGGKLVELTGDEALGVFDSARQALRAAVELQAAFAAETSADPLLPLNVGIGLDAGEAVPVGDGYRGAALNLAARLCALAGPGETIASESVVHLAGTIPAIGYIELAPADLKGVKQPVRAVRVAGEQTSPSVGPAPTLPRAAPPLPPELDPIVPIAGRLAELRWLGWHWRRAGHGAGRVLVVSGPPGMGKTRLAAELARRVHAEGSPIVYLPAGRRMEELDGTPVSLSRVPTLVIVDDLDAAAAADRRAVIELARSVDRSHTLLLLTHRLEAAAELLRLVERLGPPEQRRQLEPLEPEAVLAIAALYAGRAVDSLPLAQMLEESAGLPAAVHQLSSAWARTSAEERLSASAQTTSIGRRGLRRAETELIDSVTDLELARERSELYGPGRELGAAGRVDICPYKGLAAFEAADADYYFGRERLVAELVARLVGTSFLGVVGASGSGKSSALRAGLLPALSGGVLPGSTDWVHVVMRPGERPMAELALALGRAFPGHDLPTDEAHAALSTALGTVSAGARLVLVVDQFEELFNATRDEEERKAFIDLLTGEHEVLKVIVALRADHYGHCAAYPELAILIGGNQVLVGPPTTTELAAVIEHPARRVGLHVETGLTEELLGDLGDEPGALPLLSTALLELWQARQGGRLTLAAFQAQGGVRGAVARLAEAAWTQLDERQQQIARSILLRLAGSGEGEGVVRRRVSLSEFDTERDPSVSTVMDRLTGARLLTTGDGYVEVAHEALLREWPRLQTWLNEDAAGRQLHLHLIGAARDWEARGREPGDLYRGARLAAALDWAPTHEHELNALEREFVGESRLASERDAERQRRTNRRLRLLLAGAGVFLVLAVGAGVFAAYLAQVAREAEEFARSRELAASAIAALEEDPTLSKLLALSAASIADPPIESVSALHQAWAADRIVYRYQWPADQPVGELFMDLDPTGQLLVATGWWFDAPHRYLEVVDVDAASVLWSFEPQEETAAVGHAFFTTDGERVVFGVYRERAPPEVVNAGIGEFGVHVRDARTGEPISFWPMGDCGAAVAAASERNVLIRTSSADSCISWATANADMNVALEVMDLTSGGRTLLTTGAVATDDGALSRDGRWVAYSDRVGALNPADLLDSTPFVFDLATLAPSPIDFTGCCVRDINADGSLVLVGDGGIQRLWDVRDQAMKDTRIAGNDGGTYYAEFAPDGRTIFSTGPDGILRQWSLEGDELATVPGIVNTRPAISETGLVLAAQPGSNEALMVDTGLRSELGAVDARGAAAPIDPDPACFAQPGRLHAASRYAVFEDHCGDELVIYVIDVEANRLAHSLDGIAPALSDDGSRLAYQKATTGSASLSLGPIEIVDVPGWQTSVELEGMCTFALSDEPRPQCRPFPERPFEMSPFRLTWSSDGSMIAAVDGEGGAFVAVWDAVDGRLLADSATGDFLDPRPEGIEAGGPGWGAYDVSFTRDSRHLIISARRDFEDWYVRSISTADWTVERTRDLSGPRENALVFFGYSEDGATLFGASGFRGFGGAFLYTFDASTLADVSATQTRLHDGEFLAAAMSADGSLLATGASDGSVRIWESATGQLYHELRFRGHPVLGTTFVDERRLGVVLDDGSFRVVSIDTGQLLDIVRESLTRGFTEAECERFNFDVCPTLEEMRGD
jgi:WD40 repeat protein/energy-coupling factor transporter ATP-binding protein EcfA2